MGDAIGEMLQAYWNGGSKSNTSFQVVERSDGFVFTSDASHYFTKYEEWTNPLERQACDQATGRVLDVGCGAGRHAVHLAAKGIEVIGLDVSPGAAAITRARGVPAHEGSAAEPGMSLGRFDTFLMLDCNLGLLESRAMAPKVLSRLAALAQPGARLYGTSIDPDGFKSPAHIPYQERNQKLGRMQGQWRIRVRYHATATDWFDYLYLSPEELAEVADDTGWTLTGVTHDGPLYLGEFAYG